MPSRSLLLLALPGVALGLHVSAPLQPATAAPAVQPRAAAIQLAAAEKPQQQRANNANNDLIPDEPSLGDWVNNMPIAMSKSLARTILLSMTSRLYSSTTKPLKRATRCTGARPS